MIKLINVISNEPVIGFILIALITIVIICIASIPKVLEECDVPEANNFNTFIRFFSIEEGERIGTREKFYYIAIMRRNFIFFRTWEYLKEEFPSREEAEKFLLGRKSVSYRNNLHAILMVCKLRALKQLAEMKVA